jgi:hypothetical protein
VLLGRGMLPLYFHKPYAFHNVRTNLGVISGSVFKLKTLLPH